MKKDLNKQLLAVAIASLCATAWAGDSPATSSHSSDMSSSSKTAATRTTTSDSAINDDAINDEKNQLESKLKTVQTRSDYAKELQSSGYRISAINADKPDYLEYEVVKGNSSYEVQLDFDHGASKATGIDVTSNIWPADSTEKMLKDPTYKAPVALVADPDSRYSDRSRMKVWTDEKDQLEKALAPKQTLDAYKTTLQQRGYKITSVNDREADYVEYEIVKGDNSYEVQIDLDPTSKLATSVDVTSNLWDAEGTDRAKDANESAQRG
jgi:hypothetical protein